MTEVSRKRRAESIEPPSDSPTITTNADRMAQFRALRMRAKSEKKDNRHELYREHTRMKQDPKALKKLDFQKSVAEETLAKLDAVEAGEDFERKRAWDWTIEESEKWDEKLERAKVNEEESGFADYTQEAAKQYHRSTRFMRPDLDAYRAEQQANNNRAEGGQEMLVAADGSLIPVKNEYSSDLNNLKFISQKPKKENIDKLVSDLSKADAARLKAQVKRGRRNGDDGDYINDRNKMFNQKVSRFYDKYTKEMKESFERGTAN